MKYKVTVEEVSGEDSLVFEINNHENVLEIAQRLKKLPDLNEDDAAALGVGLKLFSGVMMNNKNMPLFKDFLPHFKDFMKNLKGSIKNRGEIV
ncbi:DUF3861 domain-containing protein [Thermophagus sp. OGC60D27]|uniref:DUF3861 domain-containing protein n=1 Tax=Thermophagus sp. OGC60D27 TaxID=3458415 RepID=UPI004037D26F